ncbi:MAG: glucosaminidase domain-containing protein, partial [Actinomycetota bacterium]|nr:glucosaminidase domain-containing protein [Actinomycetota bacterium]
GSTDVAPTPVLPGAATPASLLAVSSAAPGARPDPALDRLIHTEQLEVVASLAERAVLAAEAAARSEREALVHQEAVAAEDRATAERAARAVTAARELAATDESHLEADRSAHLGALAGVRRAARTLRMLAVELYVGPSPAAASTPAEAQQASDQQGELDTVTSAVQSEQRAATLEVRSSAVRLTWGTSMSRRARDRVGRAERARHESLERLAVAGRRAGSDARALLVAESRLRRAEVARQRAAANFDGPEGNSPDPVPTILGRPALDAAQLAGWFEASGYVALTRTSVSQLARWYIEEGDAEGVRGDLAFAQAVLETGGFSSPDAVGQNNFAGIGHCDSCARGWKFPSARLGVRAQVQLLRTYAQPGLTASELADPPVLASLDPQSQYAEGCCRTWPSLTGVWATDPVYGRSILVLYQQMLAWALAQRR